MDYTLNNSIVKSVMKLSAFRTIFPAFVMFFVNIDRFQLYVYHNRKYSMNSELFLMMINRFKALYLVNIEDLYSLLGIDYHEKLSNIRKRLEFKEKYGKIDPLEV